MIDLYDVEEHVRSLMKCRMASLENWRLARSDIFLNDNFFSSYPKK